MTFFNPLSGSLASATPPQRPSDKDRQIARSQALRKNTAAEGDRVDVEHQVESADELPDVGDDGGGGRDPQQHPGEDPPECDDAPPRIDVTA